MDAKERKQRPLFSGVLKYFPDALLEVAYTSWVGNEQHNPGQALHWAKEKSSKRERNSLIYCKCKNLTIVSEGNGWRCYTCNKLKSWDSMEINPKPASFSAKDRKERPLFSGVLKYFPDALLEVAYTSWVGNNQHNPGQPLHWAKEKSTDEADALLRHLTTNEKFDTDGVRHLAKVAWRALALLQREIEAERLVSPPSN